MKQNYPMKTKKQRSKFYHLFNWMIAAIIIGVVLNIGLLFWSGESPVLKQVSGVFLQHWWLLVPLSLLTWFTHAFRMRLWSIYLKKTITWRDSLRIAVGTDLGAAVSPTSLGGGPAKLALLMQKGFSGTEATLLTLLGSIEDYIFFMAFLVLVICLKPDQIADLLLPIFNNLNLSVVIFTTLLLLVIVAAWLLLNHFRSNRNSENRLIIRVAKISNHIRIFFSTLRKILTDGKLFLGINLVITSVQWLGRYAIILVLLSYNGVAYDVVDVIYHQFVVFALMGLAPTPGATVGAEAAFFLLFKSMVPENLITSLTLMWRFFLHYFPLIAGVFVYFLLSRNGYKFNIFSTTNKSAPGSNEQPQMIS